MRNNATTVVTVTLSWKVPVKPVNQYDTKFGERGVMVYTYDANGVFKLAKVDNLTMNGAVGIWSMEVGKNKVPLYYGGSGDWENAKPFIGTVSVTMKNTSIDQWPAIGIRAADHHTWRQIGGIGPAAIEVTGMAYITPSDKGGSCKIVLNPEVLPPPEDLRINMTAPDWDLGELERGRDTEKTFTAQKDQLCLDYKGNNFISGYQQYIIDASNRNGTTANTSRYMLKHASDAQAPGLPYDVTLNENATSLTLPNIAKRGFKLNQNGKTCFIPSIKVTTDKNAKGGRYDDILTFTIIAKP